MNEEPKKICSSCGAEYAIKAEICADCGGTLVSPEEYETRDIPLTEDEEKTLVREGPIGYLKELAEHLKQKGIRAAIRFHGGTPGTCPSRTTYGLYVTADDEAAAKELDRVYWLRGAPEQASAFKYTEQELSGTCPSCSFTIPKGVSACPECGLVVRDDEEVVTCPSCNVEVGDEIQRCPNCGAEFE